MNRVIKVVETTRKIDNSETGLDIVVPDFVISKSHDTLKTPKATYHVIITTDRRFNADESAEETQKNNTPKPIENSVVHYSIDKEFHDFLKLRNDLDKKHSGVYVPKIEISDKYSSKLAFSSKPNWKECREKQVAIDKFMGWCARTPKVAASPILKDFLGLNKLKLSKDEETINTNERSITKQRKQVYEAEDLFDELDFTKGQKDDLFGEVGEDGDLFDQLNPEFGSRASNDKQVEKVKKVNLFEAEDLTGNVSKNDDKLIIYNEEGEKKVLPDLHNPENDSDLLDVNEDINDVASQLQKVRVKAKPPLKPKPFIKPKPAPRTSKRTASASATVSVESMEQNDLLNYIKENTQRDDDLDLGF